MKPKFKVGPAKTRAGRDAVIYEISDKIYGKFNGRSCNWDLEGSYEVLIKHDYDLLSNNLPEKIEFECEWEETNNFNDSDLEIIYPGTAKSILAPLVGKRTKVTIEILEEE